MPLRRREISFRPPEEAAANARTALKIRATLPRSRRGGLEPEEAARQGIRSGVTQAKRLAEFPFGDPQATLKNPEDYYRFLTRFRGMAYRALGQGKSIENSKAIQVYLMWGGDPMLEACKRIFKTYDKEKNQHAHR